MPEIHPSTKLLMRKKSTATIHCGIKLQQKVTHATNNKIKPTFSKYITAPHVLPNHRIYRVGLFAFVSMSCMCFVFYHIEYETKYSPAHNIAKYKR